MLVVKNLVEESLLVKLQAGGRPATLLKKTLSKILFTVFFIKSKGWRQACNFTKKNSFKDIIHGFFIRSKGSIL